MKALQEFIAQKNHWNSFFNGEQYEIKTAKGRQRVWLPYEAPLGNQPFTTGLMDDEVWQWIVDRCAKHGFKAQVALISKGGNIKPHRDTTYAAAWAIGFNLGKCDWHIASTRDSAKTDFTMNLVGGEVFKFNSKHTHAVTNAESDRWSINVWAIATGPAADNANISGRLDKMLEEHPEVQEFILRQASYRKLVSGAKISPYLRLEPVLGQKPTPH